MQTTTYKLNVTPGGIPLTIHISQYDVGLRQYTFEPYTTVGSFSYVAGATVTLEATKPDGYAVIHNCTYNQDGSITYTVQEQLAAVPGRVWSKVVIRDGVDVLGTGAIIWVVDYAGVKDNAIISESDISALQQWVDDVEELKNKITIPDYFESASTTPNSFDDIGHINKVAKTVPEGEKYFFITDTHWDNDNAQNSPILLENLKNRLSIDTAIFGGDFINRQGNKYLANQVMYDFSSKMLSVFGNSMYTAIGNHDQNLANFLDTDPAPTNEQIQAMFLPYTEVYKCLFKPYAEKANSWWDAEYYTYTTNTTLKISTWTDGGMTNGEKIKALSGDSSKYAELEAYGRMTYYIDDDNLKTRFVFLMCLDKPNYSAWYDLFGTDTIKPYIAWLYRTFLATPEGYNVAYVAHEFERPYNTENEQNNQVSVVSLMLMGLKLKANKRIYHGTNPTTNEQQFASNKQFYCDFSGANNVERAYILAGHTHTDGITIINQSTSSYYTVTKSVYDGNTTINQTQDSTAGSQDYKGCPIPVIYLTTDAFGRWRDGIGTNYTEEQKTPMTKGTTSEQAFDIVTMVNSGISLTRVGAGSNRFVNMVW